ncbi:unnamed protein product [Adineta steineri]|uniref:Uncharacterized protein n=1 Tax=Adineta steineri TaxID=433720 RepID=A0A815XXX5_9BILA|nr:unnamed protein product [Adineta steineri]CAF1564003.1 unnamed protein product [Adineta steineri]
MYDVGVFIGFTSSIVCTPLEGFFAGCTPVEGLLVNTLDCLYDIKCVELLIDYFPTLNQSNVSLMDSILVPPNQNTSVYDHLLNLFIDEWSININYSKYYDECVPRSCTYTIIDQINFSYAFTLLISIYGGLIIILRLITPILVNMSMKLSVVSLRQNRTIETSFLVLIIFTSLSTQTVTITESNPSLLTYDKLQAMYPNTLKCFCSNTAIRYDKFMSLSPTLHEVCSSDFVHDDFLSALKEKVVVRNKHSDWTDRAFSHFQLLMNFCRLANETITAAVHRFIMGSMVISNMLNKNDFNTQTNVTLDQFYRSTIVDFRLAVDIQRLFVQIDQPYTGKATGPNNNVASFLFTEIYYANFTLINCDCATNVHCQTSAFIYQDTNVTNSYVYIIPGIVKGCFIINSLLYSTLQCLYVDSDCFPNLVSFLLGGNHYHLHPLIYNPTLSKYPPNTSVLEIVKELMIEQWNPLYIYEPFYESCAPSYCTYSKNIRTKNTMGVITTLVSLIGGLTVALRLITPQLVKLFYWLLTLNKKKKEKQPQQGNDYRSNIFK